MIGWCAAGAALLAFFVLGVRVSRSENHLVEHLDTRVHHLERFVMSAAQDAVNAVAATVRKGTAEVLGRIGELQSQIDAGVPAEELDLSELTAAAQALDDIVPDAPAAAVPAEVPSEVPSEVPVDAPAEVVGDPAEGDGSFDA